MPVQIGAPRESSFEQPFKLLRDCHRRVEMFLGVLAQLARREPSRLRESEAESLARALDYFRDAAPKHTGDEEDSVFPRLRQLPSAEAADALRIVAELESDHKTAGAGHAEVEALGRKWLAAGGLSPVELSRFRAQVEVLVELYRHHIEVEDNTLFPLAEQLLAGEPAVEIGREMAARRSQTRCSTTSS